MEEDSNWLLETTGIKLMDDEEKEALISNLLGWPKSSFSFFPLDGLSSACLTSLESILLDCIMTGVIPVCILKNISKLVTSCFFHFNI